jgi:uncharacterized protein YdaT
MPWDGESFRKRHAKDLSPAEARKGASVANAMLQRGVPEGEAIATGIKRAREHGEKRASKGK